MQAKVGVGVALVLGVGIGAASVHALHAQARPPVYMVAENDLSDPDGYAKEYLPKARASILAHGGQYVAAGKGTTIDGAPPKARIVILRWPSIEQLMDWRRSADYEEARTIGTKFAQFRLYAVDAVP